MMNNLYCDIRLILTIDTSFFKKNIKMKLKKNGRDRNR